MNAWKLNSTAQYQLRLSISNSLGISLGEVYKVLKGFSYDGVITTKDGKRYKLKLEEIE